MSLFVVGKYIALTWRIFIANLSSTMSFRLSFLFYLFGIFVYWGGQFFLWTIFFNQFPSVGGWTSKNLISVYSLFLFSLATLDTFAGGVIGDLANIINSGNLDYYLAFPKPVLWHLAVSKSDVTSICTIILSSFFFLYSDSISFVRILMFLLASCFSMTLLFNFYVITQSLAFFLGGFNQGASAVRHTLTIVSPYPFNVFPNGLKFILMTLIPSFFIVTLPAQLVDNFSIQTLLMLFCVSMVSSFIANKIFKFGLRRYESGNMVNVRV